MITKYISTISKKEKISNKVYLIELTLQDPTKIHFLPGQFISIEIAPNLKRSYSIASSPFIANKIDLIVDISPGGEGSRFFERIQADSQIGFLGPMGKFLLANEEDNIIFLATSTGIAPLRSMIDYLLEKQVKDNDSFKRQIYLYLGFRFEEDIFWRGYFENLEKQHPNFHFTLTLSKAKESWTGNNGYIQNFIKSELLEHKNGYFYVCGGGKMVRGVVDFLKEKNIAEEKIHFEPF